MGLTEDKQKLVLVSDSGEEFTLPADTRLRAALRGEHARLGQLEITMESALRPRDIQARIRAGESPENVAAAAQTSLEKIMGYATPVLAERAHIADRAQRASVRRKAGEGPARLLGDVVAERLRTRNVDPASVEWDSWRREDGRWTLVADYRAGERARHAEFVFDAPRSLRRGRGRRGPLARRRAAGRQGHPAARRRRRAPSAVRGRRRRGAAAGRGRHRDGRRDPAGAGTGRPRGGSRPGRRGAHRGPERHRRRRARHRGRGLDRHPGQRAPGAGRARQRVRPRRRGRPRPGRDRRAGRRHGAGGGRAGHPATYREEEEPGVRAELGRDHVRRRQARVSDSARRGSGQPGYLSVM
ncbi:DUF3071 domain-containing protein [Nocardioides panacis]|uniref:DUF3071 domain-containing protein n=1 Tax=Nocardioides panacis TaxID=2849501 RepID=A0A975Y1F7_9ACTN|nr:DUF3071 domain-containing protein [Nocardioides panacis]